jgi:hypothetical protein
MIIGDHQEKTVGGGIWPEKDLENLSCLCNIDIKNTIMCNNRQIMHFSMPTIVIGDYF